MKTVVITGSARGFGLAMAKFFREKNYNVVICDINEEALREAKEELNKIKSDSIILDYMVDITNYDAVSMMIKSILEKVKIDIWINNAGVNQRNVPIWELEEKDINRLIDIDLKGTILCSNFFGFLLWHIEVCLTSDNTQFVSFLYLL